MLSLALKSLLLSVALLVISPDVGAFKWTANRRTVGDLTEVLRDELEVKERPFQFGLAPLLSTASDDNRTGYGGSFFFDYDGLKPFAFQAVLGVYWSKFKKIFPGQRLVSFNADLDALYRPRLGRVQPYVGPGVGLISNSWPTGKPDSSYSLGGYDEQTPTENLNFGTSLAAHVRTGTFVKLSQDISLFGDIRITTNSINMTVMRTTLPSGQTYEETVHYRVGLVSLKVGIVFRVRN